MLWKQLNPRYRKLLRNGRQGQAVVVDATVDGARDDMRTDSTGFFGWNVTIRVKYDDDATADVDRYIEARNASAISPGMVVPIRFDPRKRSRVEIDTEALRARLDLEASQGKIAREEIVNRAEGEVEPLSTDPYQQGS
jgi:hypothetical protein